MAATAPRKTSCGRSSRPIITSRRLAPVETAGLSGKPPAICMDQPRRRFREVQKLHVFHDDDRVAPDTMAAGAIIRFRPPDFAFELSSCLPPRVHFLLSCCSTYDPPDVICPCLVDRVSRRPNSPPEFGALYQDMRPVPGAFVVRPGPVEYHTED